MPPLPRTPLPTSTAPSTSTLPYIQRPTLSSRAPSAGSRTQTLTSDHNDDGPSSHGPTLRLRGAPGQTAATDDEARRIRWADDVVDNEGMGRKTSKVCCIYHRPRAVGESSDEDSSDSEESGDSGGDDDGSARPSRGGAHGHGHEHMHGDGPCAHGGAGGKRRKGKGGGRGGSPNAYEKLPGLKGKGKAAQ